MLAPDYNTWDETKGAGTLWCEAGEIMKLL